MRVGLLSTVSVALLLFGLGLFWRAVDMVAQREYVGAMLVVVMGLATLQAATELVRVAFVERSDK